MARTAHAPEGIAPSVASAEAADCLVHTREAFRVAASANPHGLHSAHFRFGGLSVRLRAAGPILFEQLRRSFRPLEVAPLDGPFALTIDAWDRAHTGVGCPGVPVAPESRDPIGGGLLTQLGGGSVVRYEHATSVTALDRHRREIFFCVEDARERALHSLSKPFPDLLAVWYRDRGIQQLHAGLVSNDGQGILLVGPAGQGKTTCALACALNGFEFLGDDNVGVEVTADACVGHAFYDAVRIDDTTLHRFPRLADDRLRPIGRWERKSMVYMSDVVPDRIAARTRIEGIVVPRIVGSGPTRVTETTRTLAMRSLAPSSLMVPLGGRAGTLAAIGVLLRRVPCYQLILGADVEKIPRRLGELPRTP